MKRLLRTLLPALLFFIIAVADVFSQTTITVNGIVQTETGEPLAGATVTIKNGGSTTTTNPDGKFTLTTAPGNILTISYVGFQTTDIRATQNLTVQLTSLGASLDDVEVVVDIGYGKSKKLAVSSSIASIKAKEIQNQTGYNMGTLLQGKVTGVQVTNTSGGYPKILIRGFTSLNTSSDPLIIMDGINLGRANLNMININDVENIDILKDGAAAAIYGSDASGGVIVITTKKGKAGVVQTDVDVNYGQEFYSNPGMANATEYLGVQQRRFNNYTTPGWATNTDWWKTVIVPTNVVTANVGVSGGGEKLTSYASLSYYRTEGPFYNGSTQRATGRVNLDYKPSKFVKMGTTIYPRFENWQNSGLGGDLMSALRTEPILPIYNIRSGQNEYSQFSASAIERNANPAAVLARSRHNQNYALGLTGDVHIDIMPVKNLTIRTQAGLNTSNNFSRSYSPPFFNNFFGARDQNYDSVAVNPDQTKDNYLYSSRAYSSAGYSMDWRLTNTANYLFTINEEHRFNVLIGYESRKESGASNGAARAYIPVDQPGLWNPSNAGTPILATSPDNFLNANGSRYNETWASSFARLNYEFNNKYFIEMAIRRDGSSRFPDNKKYGNFPSISGSWIVTQEKFIQNIKPLSFLKIRAGYGTVGNASFSDPSVGLDLLSRRIVSYGGADNFYVMGGAVSNILALGRPGNPNLIWETTQDMNFAVESYWLKNRLYVNFEMYNRKSKDLLFFDNAGRPDLGIRSGAWYNLGTMEVKGMEAVVGFKERFASGFNYDVSVNMSRAKVYLNELGTNNNVPLLASSQGTYRVGEDLGGNLVKIDKGGGQLGNFFGYQVLGVFQNEFDLNAHTDKSGNLIQPNAVAGDFIFADLNGDGVINEEDKTVIGNAYPDLDLGINLRVGYKGFDVAVTGFGRFGHEVFWVAKKWLEMGSLGSNVMAGSLDKAWNGDGSTNDYPRFINDAQDANNNLKSSNSWFIEKGNYFRFNNVQLGYTFSEVLASRIKLKKLRAYVNMQNILTITSYKGLNPEIFNNDFGVLAPGFDLSQSPVRKAITVGLSVGF
ncbi:SusC/RagA family TonB-linked outer membrane protein [Flavihumibacter sp. UBA7668]|uniref:SusC/RagA family TonB-linked outer membrane protein n=1 Tax=Flavihumibacter sp. UBA7668 TaxID=1946542 RepID=UPI0025C02AEC|nr:SusC/RagA family TonB-linked outer membrane protein [Flavihumibacter sp. UBA7668]